MTIKVIMTCDVCNTLGKNDAGDGPLDRSAIITGTTFEEISDKLLKDGWQFTKGGSHIGPKCAALYDQIDSLKMGLDVKKHSMPIDHSNDKPSQELIGETELGYRSRYCSLGFKTYSGVSKHEYKFHIDEFANVKYGERKIEKIPKPYMAKRGVKGKQCRN